MAGQVRLWGPEAPRGRGKRSLTTLTEGMKEEILMRLAAGTGQLPKDIKNRASTGSC